jgi:hypothetical protein
MKWIRKIMRLFSHKEEKPTPKLRKRAKSYAEMKKIRDELKDDLRRRGIG